MIIKSEMTVNVIFQYLETLNLKAAKLLRSAVGAKIAANKVRDKKLTYAVL